MLKEGLAGVVIHFSISVMTVSIRTFVMGWKRKSMFHMHHRIIPVNHTYTNHNDRS